MIRFALTVLLALMACGRAHAGDPPAAPAQTETETQKEGRRLFAEAVAWVTGGREDRGTVRSMHVAVEDLDMDRHQGHLKVWYQEPDRFRIETSQVLGRPPGIKLLAGDRMWNSPDPGFRGTRRWISMRRMGPEGLAALGQLKEDRDRFVRLTRFVSLGGFMGKGVVFESLGPAAFAQGHLKGRWVKVRRRAPGGERLSFLLATERGPDGGLRATWPGAVLTAAAKDRPADHVVLKHWTRGGHPRRVERWQADARGVFRAVMSGHLAAVQVNAPIPPEHFEPRVRPGTR